MIISQIVTNLEIKDAIKGRILETWPGRLSRKLLETKSIEKVLLLYPLFQEVLK